MKTLCVFAQPENIDPDGTIRYRCAICKKVATTKKTKPPKRNCQEGMFDCVHRGEVLRQETCNSCATGRGQIVDVFACDVHGECVKRQHRTPATIQDCQRCIELKKGWKPSTFPRNKQAKTDVIAVTSIAPNDAAMDALESWQDAGLHVVAFQAVDELDSVKAIYGKLVDEWVTVYQDSRWQFGRKPLPYIWQMVDLASARETPIMLINSDIIISGDNSKLVEWRDASHETLIVGRRHNFVDWRDASIERNGFDVFFIGPKFRLPEICLPIGVPPWDYWIIYHAQQIGWNVDILDDKIFFHRKHSLNWSETDFLEGARIMHRHGYTFGMQEGFTLQDAFNATDVYRTSLRMVTV